ncbi:restriction endonuclease subunit S [Clostridium sp. YIM B02506]|uniref:restriction endonuclease subunit S n=1 Tax=Clostridium sp. YIM B02506 TaxID=2910680 RepID=UPI001EEDF545|nr:restriction endonuclease subunit S [Clostridium sp. YIM B02506]
MRYTLAQIFEKPISGEWGVDLNEDTEGVKVIRTTNFTNLGRLNLSDVVLRKIDTEKHKNKMLKYGDVIIEKSGGSPTQPVGRVVIFEENTSDKYYCNNFTSVLRPTKLINHKYSMYLLKDLYNKGRVLKYQNKTTGIINLKLNDYLQNTEVILPNLDTQQKISNVLDKAQKLIDKRKAQIQALDELVKSRFIEMFGNPATNSKGWVVEELSKCLINIENGKSFVCENFSRKGEYPAILKLSAVTYGTYNPSENKALTGEDLFVGSVEVKNGDLLFTRKNTPELVGMSAYVYETSPKLMMPDLIFRLNTNEKCNKGYLWKLINHDLFRENIKALSNGSAKSMSNISKERLMKLNIPLPPIELQNQFADFVNQVDKLKFEAQKSLTEMESNFNALMQRAFK